MQNCDKALSLLSEFIQSILFLLLDVYGFSTSWSWCSCWSGYVIFYLESSFRCLFLVKFEVSLLLLACICSIILVIQSILTNSEVLVWCLSCLKGIHKARDLMTNHSGSLLHWIRITQRINVLDAVDHIVCHWLQQIWLILKREVLVCVAAEDGKRVQGPVDLRCLPGFEGKHETLWFCFCLWELYFERVIVLCLEVQTRRTWKLTDLICERTVLYCFLDKALPWSCRRQEVICSRWWISSQGWLNSAVHPLLEDLQVLAVIRQMMQMVWEIISVVLHCWRNIWWILSWSVGLCMTVLTLVVPKMLAWR